MRTFLTFLGTAIAFTGIGWSTPAQAIPCRAYTVDAPDEPYQYREINNCPILNGTFTNSNWKVEIGQWEPAAYYYKGRNLSNGSSIELIDFDVTGTTDRPQYRFYNGNVTYIVSFRDSDQNTIRLEVYQKERRILNQLLYR
ncbi:MAG: hypothetical protein F6K16_02650 [Symploca sp. SIO2B6]|nr:hypothetical protein [Symploca sp. SIO2B6]